MTNEVTRTAPEKIYLCISDETDDNDMPYPELYAEDAEITWSTDQPVAVTVEYVRADIAAADLAAARALLRSLEFSANGYCPVCNGTLENIRGPFAERYRHTKSCKLDAALAREKE